MQHKIPIGDRMKKYYEIRSQTHLTRRMPVILRVDGRAFHTLTKKLQLVKPFDEKIQRWMVAAGRALCEGVQGAKLAYIQSDEISILITDYDTLQTEAWFDYNVQKMTSVSASIATSVFTEEMNNDERNWFVTFDSRVFNVPREEANNYFVWRQQDWIKNSVQMLARAYYSQKELLNKKQSDMHEMLHEKGINWADIPNKWKNGVTLEYEEFDSIELGGNLDISNSGLEPIIRHAWDENDVHIFSKEPVKVNDLVET
jgi:tRNA(His) 5'-end guanylyltransferase